MNDSSGFSYQNDTFPGALPWPALYQDNAKIVISAFVLIVGILFFFPVM